MSIFPGPYNPITYAQYRLQGGWQRLLIITSVFAVILLVLLHFSTFNSDTGTYDKREVQGWCYGLLMIQAAVMWLFGSFRVENSVRGDVSSRLIESHRMMPTPALGSVLGYLFGSPFQAFAIAIIVTLIGAPCCAYVGIQVDQWLLSNAVIVGTAVMVWSGLVLLGLSIRGGFLFLLLGGPVTISVAANAGDNIPALSVLLHLIVSRHTIFDPDHRHADINGFGFLATVVADAILVAIFLRAAVRKYRNPDDVGLSPLLGLMLVACWTVMSIIGAANEDTFGNRYSFNSIRSEDGAVALSTILAMLLSMAPISAAARQAAMWDRSGGQTPASPRRPLPVWLVTGLAVVVTSGVMAIVADRLTSSLVPFYKDYASMSVVVTVAVVALFLTNFAFLFRWVYLRRSKALGIAFIWLVIVTLGPILTDVFYRQLNESPSHRVQPTTPAMAASGIAAIAVRWDGQKIWYVPGLAVQAAFAAVPAALYFRRRKSMATVAAEGFPVVDAAPPV